MQLNWGPYKNSRPYQRSHSSCEVLHRYSGKKTGWQERTFEDTKEDTVNNLTRKVFQKASHSHSCIKEFQFPKIQANGNLWFQLPTLDNLF